jgi:hypothetical protein
MSTTTKVMLFGGAALAGLVVLKKLKKSA